MEYPFTALEVKNMIIMYYRTLGEVVDVTYSFGKVIHQKKYLPPCNVLSFIVKKRIQSETGEELWESIPICDDDIERVICTILDRGGFAVTAWEYTNSGIKVTYEQKSIEEKSM